MITYSPSYILSSSIGGIGAYDGRQPTDYLPLYEHFARKVLDQHLRREILIDTSGINFWEFGPLASQSDAATVLAKLFASVGTGSPRGRFLRKCGIRKWSDLAKPICVKGWECKLPIGYDVRERRLREPGPNEFHPKAVFGQSCFYQFGTDRRWRFVLRYGYSRDPSSWSLVLRQGREALSTFVRKSVPRWLDERLELEQWWDTARTHANREFDRLTSAVETLFTWESLDPEWNTTEALVQDMMKHRRRLGLTKRRLGSLRRWAQTDAATAKGVPDGE